MSVPYLIIDVETTGLDTERALLMEIAILALDENLNEVGCINYVIDPRTIEPFNEHNIEAGAMNLHAGNGLLKEIADGQCLPMEVVRGNVLRWCAQMGIDVEKKWQAIMAGSNPAFDRAFIRRFLPEVSLFLHYRMIDVSTMRTMAGIVLGHNSDYLKGLLWPVKQGPTTHRALTDCRNSLAELRAYRNMMESGKQVIG